jgi:hypothetical protein
MSLHRQREHGTYACYQKGPSGTSSKPSPCRCDACRAASRDYIRRYRARGADGWVNKTLGTCVRGLGWPRATADKAAS